MSIDNISERVRSLETDTALNKAFIESSEKRISKHKLECNNSKEDDRVFLEEMKEGIKEILEIMNGNGKLGLCGKVSVMWGVGIFMIIGMGTQSFILIRMFLEK